MTCHMSLRFAGAYLLEKALLSFISKQFVLWLLLLAYIVKIKTYYKLSPSLV